MKNMPPIGSVPVRNRYPKGKANNKAGLSCPARDSVQALHSKGS
jgi:hypothetical protein